MTVTMTEKRGAPGREHRATAEQEARIRAAWAQFRAEHPGLAERREAERLAELADTSPPTSRASSPTVTPPPPPTPTAPPAPRLSERERAYCREKGMTEEQYLSYQTEEHTR